jgi:DNA-binding MarR family transcriptional regulator
MGVAREDAAATRASDESSRAPTQADADDETHAAQTAHAQALAREGATPMLETDLPPAPPARSVGFTLSSLGFAISGRFVQTLAPLALEPREFALLRAVHAAEGRTQQSIAASLQIPASRMVAFVDALEARGLMQRRSNPRDRRARALHLTDSGVELLDRAIARAAELELELCAGMSDQEREVLLELLQRVGAALGVPAGVHAASSTPAREH